MVWSLSDVKKRSVVASVNEATSGSLLSVETNGVAFAELNAGTKTFEFEALQGGMTMSFSYAGGGFAVLSDFCGLRGLRFVIR